MNNNNKFNDSIILVDEEGNEVEFEYFDTVEYEGKYYVALIPAKDDNEKDEEEEEDIVILRMEKDEEGNDSLVSIEDDDEYEAVFDELQNSLWNDEDEPDEYDGYDDEDECCDCCDEEEEIDIDE